VAGVVVAVYAMTVFAVAITAAAGTRDVTQGGGHLSPTTLEVMPTVRDEGVLDSAVDRLSGVPGVTTVAMGRIRGDSTQDSQVILEADKAEALGAPHVAAPDGAVSISTRWLYENAAASPSPVSAGELKTAHEQGAPVLLVGTDPASPGAVETSGTSVSVSPRGSVLRNNSWGLFGSSTMDDSTTTFLNSSWRSRTLVTARLSASTSKFSGVNSK